MASWRAAATMLTRLPIRTAAGDRLGSPWFGLVGALLGGAGSVPLLLLGTALPAGAAILAVATIVVLTGALHLDGLADTADALTAIDPAAAERARKDPSVGAGGATALILVLGLQVTSLAALAAASGAVVAGLACLVAGAASRAVPVIVGRIARPLATGTGLGATFARQVTFADAAIAALTALGAAVVATLVSGSAVPVLGCALGLGAGGALGLGIVGLRGRLDGDGLGATVELSFAASLLSAAAIGRWPAL